MGVRIDDHRVHTQLIDTALDLFGRGLRVLRCHRNHAHKPGGVAAHRSGQDVVGLGHEAHRGVAVQNLHAG